MRRSLILPATAAVCLLSSAGSGSAAPERTIILFGANWCAPCLDELRDLPGLEAAAGSDRLVVAWIDAAPRMPATGLPEGVELLSRGAAREFMARHGAGNAGLPLVVMLDADGTRCAMLRRRLTGDGIAALRRSCDLRQ